MNRKEFLTKASLLTFGLLSTPQLLSKNNEKIVSNINLIKDPNGILYLPRGFKYNTISIIKIKF